MFGQKKNPSNAVQKSTSRILIEYAGVLSFAALIAWALRTYLIETFRMPSRSMVPTVQPGDTLFVKKWRWRLSKHPEPHLGEVVVFQFESEPGRNYIKRVVGLPGDVIDIKDGVLYRNKERVTAVPTESDEPCLPENLSTVRKYSVCLDDPKIQLEEPVKIPIGHAFVIGDYRSLTQEPRKPKTHGLVPFHLISGSAWVIWLSVRPDSGGSGFSRIEFSRMFKNID